jgi:hypothetical protein
MHFFGILLLVPLGCRSQSYFYISFSLAGFTFKSSKISSLFMWFQRVYPVGLKKFISIDANRCVSFFLRFQISLHIKERRVLVCYILSVLISVQTFV